MTESGPPLEIPELPPFSRTIPARCGAPTANRKQNSSALPRSHSARGVADELLAEPLPIRPFATRGTSLPDGPTATSLIRFRLCRRSLRFHRHITPMWPPRNRNVTSHQPTQRLHRRPRWTTPKLRTYLQELRNLQRRKQKPNRLGRMISRLSHLGQPKLSRRKQPITRPRKARSPQPDRLSIQRRQPPYSQKPKTKMSVLSLRSMLQRSLPP